MGSSSESHPITGRRYSLVDGLDKPQPSYSVQQPEQDGNRASANIPQEDKYGGFGSRQLAASAQCPSDSSHTPLGNEQADGELRPGFKFGLAGSLLRGVAGLSKEVSQVILKFECATVNNTVPLYHCTTV